MSSDIVTSWLNKAEDDLKWTKSNIKERVWYGACFTAHQSVEKSLKSFLLSKERPVAKIHDLSALVERCKEIDDSFEELVGGVISISDYYISSRYPDVGDFMSYSKENAEEAYDIAKDVFEFVRTKLFNSTSPKVLM